SSQDEFYNYNTLASGSRNMDISYIGSSSSISTDSVHLFEMQISQRLVSDSIITPPQHADPIIFASDGTSETHKGTALAMHSCSLQHTERSNVRPAATSMLRTQKQLDGSSSPLHPEGMSD